MGLACNTTRKEASETDILSVLLPLDTGKTAGGCEAHINTRGNGMINRRAFLTGLAAPVILSAVSLEYVPRGIRLVKPHYVPGMGSVWQDAEGTIPAYDGDPVGLVDGGDIFNMMIQPDRHSRPRLMCQRHAGALVFDTVRPEGSLVFDGGALVLDGADEFMTSMTTQLTKTYTK